jgi:hypothetical protein
MTVLRCRLCDDEALAVFGLSRGCVAFPADRIQAMCLHHALRSTPLGSLELLADLTECEQFTEFWEGDRKW